LFKRLSDITWKACYITSTSFAAVTARYTGQTTDLDKRVLAHNRGIGARYTRGRGRVQLVYHVGVTTLREAFILECRIKRMPRAGKEKLIATAESNSQNWFPRRERIL